MGVLQTPALSTWLRRLHAIENHSDQQPTGYTVGLDTERAMGFEPMTFSLARRHSTTKLRPQPMSAEAQN
jgi:hypothetical protein